VSDNEKDKRLNLKITYKRTWGERVEMEKAANYGATPDFHIYTNDEGHNSFTTILIERKRQFSAIPEEEVHLLSENVA
jgi:hypothetical protein